MRKTEAISAVRGLICVIALAFGAFAHAEPSPVSQPWVFSELSAAPNTYPVPGIAPTDPRIRALFYDGLPYQGKPTRVFAWLGVPVLPAGERAPGIVLIHGGQGTAFESWVKRWLDRGYAAIAMDTCGALPIPDNVSPRPRHDFSGPPGWGDFGRMSPPIADHWATHAVGAVLLGHGLLAAQPGVDTNRIGVTGVSWGGYLTLLSVSADTRFKFAIPVYGCGFTPLTRFAPNTVGADGGRWMKQWDPQHFIPRIKIPTLWLTGSNEEFYYRPAFQQSYQLQSPALRTTSILSGLTHSDGNGHGGRPDEIAAFADSVVRKGMPLPGLGELKLEDDHFSANYTCSAPPARAELCYSEEAEEAPKSWVNRVWQKAPATIEKTLVHAPRPPTAKIVYLNLYDARGLVVSSNYLILPADP